MCIHQRTEDRLWSFWPNDLWRWSGTHCDHNEHKCKCKCIVSQHTTITWVENVPVAVFHKLYKNFDAADRQCVKTLLKERRSLNVFMFLVNGIMCISVCECELSRCWVKINVNNHNNRKEYFMNKATANGTFWLSYYIGSSVHPRVQVDVWAKFKEIPSRNSCDFAFTNIMM